MRNRIADLIRRKRWLIALVLIVAGLIFALLSFLWEERLFETTPYVFPRPDQSAAVQAALARPAPSIKYGEPPDDGVSIVITLPSSGTMVRNNEGVCAFFFISAFYDDTTDLSTFVQHMVRETHIYVDGVEFKPPFNVVEGLMSSRAGHRPVPALSYCFYIFLPQGDHLFEIAYSPSVGEKQVYSWAWKVEN